MTPEEQKEIQKIAYDFFKQESGSDEEAKKMLGALALITKEPSSKIIHVGNVLFLILVRAKHVVEVHTIGNEAQPRDLAQDFVDLVKYLKHLEVKTAYTYTPDNRFTRLAKMTGLPVKTFKKDIDGKPMNVYVMEI